MMKINYKKLIGIIIITILVGSFFTFFTGSSIYKEIIKPPFSPPGLVFPIVWTILYILMSIALYQVLEKNDENDLSLTIYGIQLFFNSTWTLIFFGFKNFLLGSIWIFLLIMFVVIMFIHFYKIKKSAGLLIIPYLIWLFIALYLNIGIFILN